MAAGILVRLRNVSGSTALGWPCRLCQNWELPSKGMLPEAIAEGNVSQSVDTDAVLVEGRILDLRLANFSFVALRSTPSLAQTKTNKHATTLSVRAHTT